MSPDARELQRLFDSAAGVVELEPRTYVVDTPLRLGPIMGGGVRGAGGLIRSPSLGWRRLTRATRIHYVGPADRPIVTLSGSGVVLSDLTFTGVAACAIKLVHGAGTLNFSLDRVSFMEQRVGVRCGSSRHEATCANVSYYDCYWQGCGTCVEVFNDQSVDHRFWRPQFNWTDVGVRVVYGGCVSIVGGGCYELGTLLHIDRAGRNARGFSVRDMRCDGRGTRTAWLTVEAAGRVTNVGSIRLEGLSQVANQRRSERPLVTVPPAARCVIRECALAPPDVYPFSLGRVVSTAEAAAELVVERCDGIDGNRLGELVELIGPRSRVAIRETGSMFGEVADFEASS